MCPVSVVLLIQYSVGPLDRTTIGNRGYMEKSTDFTISFPLNNGEIKSGSPCFRCCLKWTDVTVASRHLVAVRGTGDFLRVQISTDFCPQTFSRRSQPQVQSMKRTTHLQIGTIPSIPVKNTSAAEMEMMTGFLLVRRADRLSSAHLPDPLLLYVRRLDVKQSIFSW